MGYIVLLNSVSMPPNRPPSRQHPKDDCTAAHCDNVMPARPSSSAIRSSVALIARLTREWTGGYSCSWRMHGANATGFLVHAAAEVAVTWGTRLVKELCSNHLPDRENSSIHTSYCPAAFPAGHVDWQLLQATTPSQNQRRAKNIRFQHCY